MTPAYDKELNLLYFTVGNPSPDLDGSVRPGDNLFTDCIVAVDAATGKTRWYYQVVPHDVWDLDQTSPPVVMTLNGQKVVVQAGKTAWMYVLDAKTGKLVRKTENFTPQKNMFALPTAEGTLMLPGANGGSEWSPISVDPNLHYAYVAGLNQPMLYKVHPAPYEKGRLWLGSAFNLAPGSISVPSAVGSANMFFCGVKFSVLRMSFPVFASSTYIQAVFPACTTTFCPSSVMTAGGDVWSRSHTSCGTTW
jgi:glucose dehydrogenase